MRVYWHDLIWNPSWFNALKTFHKIGFIKQKSQSIFLLQSIILSLGFTIDYPCQSIILSIRNTIDYTFQSIKISLDLQPIIQFNRLYLLLHLQSIIHYNRLCEPRNTCPECRLHGCHLPLLFLYINPARFLQTTMLSPPLIQCMWECVMCLNTSERERILFVFQ